MSNSIDPQSEVLQTNISAMANPTVVALRNELKTAIKDGYPEGGLRAWLVVLGAWCATIPFM
ncbi:hypothetical protein B0J11DRAFT_567193, partial [Dendryphion nanum]